MSRLIQYAAVMIVFLVVGVGGCGSGAPLSVDDAVDYSAPDGIDPQNAYIERSTTTVDFAGVRTIRIEIPTARVSVSQADGNGQASVKVTEVIFAKGLSNEALAEKHAGSAVTAERSFVDQARLDIKATIAEGLADTDIAFDVRLVIPSPANIEVLVADGQVEVTDVTGNVEIHTGNGAVTVSGVTGNIIAETTLHSITVANVTGNVQVETTEADISLRLTPAPTGAVSATTSKGVIHLTIAQTTGAALNLSAPDGTVTANLGGFSVSNLSTGAGFLTGVLNGGGGQIEAVATNGEIEFVGM